MRDSSSFLLNNYSNKNFSIGFNKQLHTYNFNSFLIYNYETSNLFVGLNENFNSTISKTITKNIRDEQFFSIIGEYKLFPSLIVGTLINNTFYSDDRKISINKASNLNGAVYTKISPHPNITLIPYGGYSYNQQIGENDNGYIYGAEAFATNISLKDFDIFSTLKFQNEDISPRKNTMRLVNLNVSNKIEQTITNIASAYYLQQRKDFYFETDSLTSLRFDIKNNLQSRTESNYFIQDHIVYSSGSLGLNFDILGRISWRNIDRETRYVIPETVTASSFDSRIEEFKIDFSSETEYRHENFNANIKFSISEREEKHFAKKIDGANQIVYQERINLESQRNNTSQQFNLAVSGNIKLSENNDLLVSLLHRKLIYDTPSEDNYDDRDELLTIFRAMYLKRFSPFFNMFLNLEGSINHIVYIFAERSSNNNTRRILKLSSGGSYLGSRFSTNTSVEVSANYTVFDFQELSANLKSYSFRQFALRDSSGYALNRNISLVLLGYLKLSEQGDFKWDNFSSRPVRFLRETYVEPMIYYTLQEIKLGIGLRHFSLSTFGYNQNNQKALLSDYTSLGPLTEITISMNNSLDLRIYGWYEFISTEDNSKRELANLNLRLNWRL